MRTRTTLIASALLASTATPAMATPYVDVHTFWTAFLPLGTPAGITVSACTNGATFSPPTPSQADGGCSGFLTLNQTITASANLSTTLTQDVVLTNDTGAAVGIQLDLEFAAVFPGGDFGIDDPATESAMLTSTILGSGESVGASIGASISCSIPDAAGYTTGAEACNSFNEGIFDGVVTGELQPGPNEFPFISTITASFSIDPAGDPVPEPATWLLLVMGMLGMMSTRFIRSR